MLPYSSDEVSKQRLPESEAYDADFDTVVDGVELDDDEDDVSGFLEFDDRESSCDETEVEIESIQKVHQMKLQHIKDRLLGTVSYTCDNVQNDPLQRSIFEIFQLPISL